MYLHEHTMTEKPKMAFASPQAAIEALADRLLAVEAEEIPLTRSSGRILRHCVSADRDSPAADVSAMDGYAVCMADLSKRERLSVSGESVPGHAPPRCQPGKVVRIFTGGIVPDGFDLVIRREDTQEEPDAIRFTDAARDAPRGQNIRRRGENAGGGDEILPVGGHLHAGAIAAAANFGAAYVAVSRPVRVALIVTGDELRSVDDRVEPWQLRDSNGITLASLLNNAPWIEVVSQAAVDDDLPTIRQTLTSALEQADAVVMTGGVSMGDYDHVPTAVEQAGAEIIFHKLPVRPGKPILGAVDPKGRPIIGLPGNPVSAAIGGRRFLLPWLAKMAGSESVGQPAVMLVDRPPKTLPLYWMRLVQLQSDGRVRLVPSRGSGDLVSLALSTGFIEQPPHADSLGPWPYWDWS